MAELYRKYLKPEYGEAAPDAVIPSAQGFDISLPTEYRIMQNFETITDLTMLWKNCYCFKKIMTVKTVNTFVHKQDHDIPVRIYLPHGDGPFKVMVFYHGGGWMMNSLDVYDYVPRYFAQYGNVLVITPEYRLAPEHRFPQGLQDCYDTLVWAHRNAALYGGDTSSVSVCGDSAGGNIAAVVSLMARDSGGPAIHKQFLFFPATVMNLGYRTTSEKRYGNGDYFLAMNSEDENLVPAYLVDPADASKPYVSPLLAPDLSNLPPAMFLSAECDPLLDQGLMYAAKLEDSGNQVEYNIYKGMIHAFLNRPQQKTFEAMNDVISALPPILKGEENEK